MDALLPALPCFRFLVRMPTMDQAKHVGLAAPMHTWLPDPEDSEDLKPQIWRNWVIFVEMGKKIPIRRFHACCYVVTSQPVPRCHAGRSRTSIARQVLQFLTKVQEICTKPGTEPEIRRGLSNQAKAV